MLLIGCRQALYLIIIMYEMSRLRESAIDTLPSATSEDHIKTI